VQALALLRTHLQPILAPDPVAVTKLVERSQQGDAKAKAELLGLGQLAELALHELLNGTPSPTLKQHLGQLLEEIKSAPPSAETMRGLRAIDFLRRSKQSEAQEILAALAKGAPDALLTREATAALDRLRTDA
jgi:hypothetical protein